MSPAIAPPPAGPRSAIIVAFPEAAPVVDELRESTCEDKPSIGVPAHVTVLFPFVPARELDELRITELRAVFRTFETFALEFRELRRFPGTLYLAPEPAAPFVAMTERIVERFPAYPPYGGAFTEIVPHLTVAQGEPRMLAAATATVAPALPIPARASRALVIQEWEPRRWRVRAELPFGP